MIRNNLHPDSGEPVTFLITTVTLNLNRTLPGDTGILPGFVENALCSLSRVFRNTSDSTTAEPRDTSDLEPDHLLIFTHSVNQ
jgi:hypothetical protein